ncbi:MAG: hypothetical protein WC404_06225 [Candidatus Omnitrophota bacterium]
MQYIQEQHTYMDIRREQDRKMKWSCVWGAVFMWAVGLMAIIAMRTWV